MDVTVMLDQAFVQAAATPDFVHVRVDADCHRDLFARWVGGGPGLATCVLEPDGPEPTVVALRVGPAPAQELVALLATARADRDVLRQLRGRELREVQAAQAVGELLHRNGATHQAQHTYSRALRLAETSGAPAEVGRLQLGLAELAIDAGDVETARHYLDRMNGASAAPVPPLPTTDFTPRASTVAARVLFAERQLSATAELVGALLTRFPHDPRADRWLLLGGEALLELNRRGEALELLLRLRDALPESPLVDRAAAKILQLRTNQPETHVH
jgi:tetratricopeptide (TPR) repeat protein